MYKFFGLVLISALVAVSARRININAPLDRALEEMNIQQRLSGNTSAPFPEIQLYPKVKYSRATFLGVDSMKRTSDCWTEINVNEFTLDINYGFGLASLVLPHLEIDGKNMSAYATVRNNSVHLSYTVSLVEQKCHIKLNELKVEKLGNVEFGASRLEYDNSNLDGFFKLIVTPMLNGILDTNFAKIEIALQALCNVRDFHNPGHAPQLLMSLLI